MAAGHCCPVSQSTIASRVASRTHRVDVDQEIGAPQDFAVGGLGLIEPGHLTWPEMIRKLTINPAQLLGIPKGTLQAGADADVTLIDPETRWTIDASKFHSKSRNTPYGGWAHTVIVGGEVRYTLGGIVRQGSE